MIVKIVTFSYIPLGDDRSPVKPNINAMRDGMVFHDEHRPFRGNVLVDIAIHSEHPSQIVIPFITKVVTELLDGVAYQSVFDIQRITVNKFKRNSKSSCRVLVYGLE